MTVMGRGNVCTFQPYEGLYYIDNGQYHVYRKEDPENDCDETCLMGELDYSEMTGGDWKFDEIATWIGWKDIEDSLVDDFTKRFPSFEDVRGTGRWVCDSFLYNGVEVLMESKLFYIGIEDNQWSMAVMLIQKDPPWGYCIEGLQARHYQRYLDGIRDCLFNRLDELGTYSGAWTSGTIRKEAASA